MAKKTQGSKILFYIIGFFLIFIAFSGSFAHFYQQFSDLRTALVQTTNNNDIQLRAAMAMRVAVRERAILLWHMTLTDDFFERDELFERFYGQGANYQKSRIALLNSTLDSSEQALIQRLDAETNERAPVLRQFADLLMEEIDRDFTHELNQVLSDQIIVADQLDSLIEHQQQHNIAEREASAINMGALLSDLVITIVAIVFFGFIFAGYVIANTQKQSRNLKAANQQLEHIACHDSLTGLPNRMFLLEQLEVTLSASRRKKEHAAVLFIDLDNFKPINDNFGHETGDHCLIKIAKTMSSALRGSDMVGRLGGDEFLVILSDITSTSHVTFVANKLLQALSEPITIDGQSFSLSASIGIYIHHQDAITAEECIDLADKAMYQAKRAGKNQFVSI